MFLSSKLRFDTQFSRFSLFFSLLAGNWAPETGSTSTASATTHSGSNGDFLNARELPHIWRASLLRTGLRKDRVESDIVIFVDKSLAAKSRFLGNGDGESGDSVRMRRLWRGQAKYAVLARPLGG